MLMSPQKLFSFSRYLSFCLDFLVIYRNGLILKDKFNFEFYEVTAWLKNNCNINIAQYLEKLRQSDNEIWSVNRM